MRERENQRGRSSISDEIERLPTSLSLATVKSHIREQQALLRLFASANRL
jgi:hypothetical protein